MSLLNRFSAIIANIEIADLKRSFKQIKLNKEK